MRHNGNLHIMAMLILLLIPILGYLTFHWLRSIVNEELAGFEMNAEEFCSEEFAKLWSDAGMSKSQLAAACAEIEPIFWLGDASLYSGIASVVFLILVVLLSRIAGRNRARLASVFSFLVPFSLLFIAISTIVQGAIFTYSLYALQVNLMEAWYPVVTLGVGLGALIVAVYVINSAFAIKRQVTMSQMAINADKESYSELWKFVESIAEKIGAPVPSNIAIGLEPTFYATSANVKVLSSDENLSGETLYISLPLMRLFSKDEFGAVIGHELGHFKGSDVVYTMKFAPLYRALSTAVDKTGNEARIMSIPALAVLNFLLNRFSLAEKEISRQREFEADIVGAAAVSSDALCAALIKVTAFSNLWSDLLHDVVENLEYGRPVTNLSSLYASRVAFDTDADVAKKVVQENLDFKIPHPTDTHPTLSERLDNLGMHDDFSYLQMSILEDSSLMLVQGAAELEKELSFVQQRLYQALGIAQYESKKPEDSEVSYGIARMIQTAAAVMVCADGQVEPSEIAEAEEKGKNMISHFNSLEFREACLNPEALPNVTDLSQTIKEIFSQQHIELMVDFLENIAAADGHVSIEEEEFIKQLTE